LAPTGFTASEGGLRSWLDVRWIHTSALYLTAPPSCGGSAGPSCDVIPKWKAQPKGGLAQRVATNAEPA